MITIKKYIKKMNFNELVEFERVKYIAYYLFITGNHEFEITQLINTLQENGYYISNLSRLKKKIKESKLFKNVKNDIYTLTTLALKELQTLSDMFESEEIDEVEAEYLNTNTFCGQRAYIDKLVSQVNKCYEEHCYDACATMLRRILEITLISCYEHLGIEQLIKDLNGNYFMLEKICNDAKNNSTLNLSRIKNKMDSIRDIGNYAAHRIRYNTTKKDLDDVKMDYRVLLEELYYKANYLK